MDVVGMTVAAKMLPAEDDYEPIPDRRWKSATTTDRRKNSYDDNMALHLDFLLVTNDNLHC